MNAIESPPSPVRGASVWPLSVAAYHTLGEAGLIPERTELLYGFVYHQMSKSPLHSSLVVRLVRLLQSSLPAGVHLRSEQPITCSNSEPEPDLAVVRGAESDFWTEHPKTADLVIEVCVTSHDYEQSKLPAYASAAVKECWLVLGTEKQIEVYRRPSASQFLERTVHSPTGRVESASVPGFAVELAALFAP
jgi:Uma2 family endonuclease